MIYLILKMAVYLLVALATGAGAGWLARNFAAQKREDELHRQLNELKAKLPQHESLMRARDEQLQGLREEVREKDARIGELHDAVAAGEKELRSKARELKETHARQRDDLLLPEAGEACAGIGSQAGVLHAGHHVPGW